MLSKTVSEHNEQLWFIRPTEIVSSLIITMATHDWPGSIFALNFKLGVLAHRAMATVWTIWDSEPLPASNATIK